jgi:adenosine deaminase
MLLGRRQETDPSICSNLNIPTSLELIQDFFPLFKHIYELTNDEISVKIAVKETIKEFAADGCRYLELRSTPRGNADSGMTCKSYVEALIEGSKDADIVVRWILSMDRRKSLSDNLEILSLAACFADSGVVGVDICGDPHQGNLKDLEYLIKLAKAKNLKVTVHLAEISDRDDETEALIEAHPDRIGHGTFINPESKQNLLNRSIPLEICLTSNVFCKTVVNYSDHHFYNYMMNDHPCILCTDDKGIFNCSLSGEYLIAAKTFNLGKRELYELSKRCIQHIFASDEIKKELLLHWEEFELSRIDLR